MKKILIVVDVQNDFCPGGALATEEGEKIIPNINRLLNEGGFERAAATQDWHPAGHVSFASTHGKQPFETVKIEYGEQTLWPDHCVQAAQGAEFHPRLDTRNLHFIVRKGYHLRIDSYSGFFENDKKTSTGMSAIIDHITGGEQFLLVICGIATDVCVFNTAMDARMMLGYEQVTVAVDACAGVSREGTRKALGGMERAGIRLLTTETVLEIP